MDSIVGAFIPVIKRIGSEVESVDMLVAGMQDNDEWLRHWHDIFEQAETTTEVVGQPCNTITEENDMTNISQKEKESSSILPPSPQCAWPRFWKYSSRITAQVFRYLKLGLLVLWSSWISRLRRIRLKLWFSGLSDREKWRAIKMARMKTLMKMSEARRTVTLLGRLLAPKNEVLGILRKRLVNSADLGAHLSDVQGGS